MQKVWVLAETVTVLTDIAENLALIIKLLIPLVCAVMRLGCLQTTQNTFVIVGDSGDFLYSDGTIERIVGIEAARIRLWLV